MLKFVITRIVNSTDHDELGRPVQVREYMLATRETNWTRSANHEHIARFATRAIAESVAFHATDCDMTDANTIVEEDAD